MVKKIEFTVPDQIVEFAENVCLNGNMVTFNRTLYLKALAAEYMSVEDDETAKKIEALIDRLENL